MKNHLLIVAYEGTHYYGWQETSIGPSIEGVLGEVLKQLLGHRVILQAASRTDRGVHAYGQVVSFFSEKSPRLESLNALLPPSIRVLRIKEVANTFHPTVSAVGKEYLYRIDTALIQLPFNRHMTWHVYGHFDLERARQSAQTLVGRHDFSAFCNTHEGRDYPDTIRELWWFELVKEGELLTCYLGGNHFLYKMARNLVGIVIEVGRGKRKGEEVGAILAGKKRAEGGICAPAQGLALNRVFYKRPTCYNGSHD